MALIHPWTTAMTPKDKQFYEALGGRIAQFRKAQSLTQQQLAERLGISQQTMAHYEVGRLRVPVSMLPELSEVLAVSFEELLGNAPEAGKGKRGPASKLQQQIEQVRHLPRTKQKFVSEMLETVLKQTS
jgi:transcriptional regulator with XRE-family HTH domain